MPRNSSSARKRIVSAALDLFSSQGFGSTTTKQIADLAGTNEVTVFRNFGSKHDLLLAVVEASGAFAYLPQAFGESVTEVDSLSEAVRRYSRERLQALEQLAELLRAFIGEAGQYSSERRHALGQELLKGTQEVARHFAAVIERAQIDPQVPPEKLIGLLNNLLFGYLITELTSEFQELWRDREEFLDSLVQLCLYGAMPSPEKQDSETSGLATLSPSPSKASTRSQPLESNVADLPAELVRKILQQAKKQGAQHYALAYLLFGAGLLAEEVLGLERSHHFCTPRQHLVQVAQGAVRHVPVNQWIAGKRYGSYGNNPLSQWLKSRKDDAAAIFITEQGLPLSASDLSILWQEATADLLTPENSQPCIEQARQTWCVEMLMKGMSPEDLSILSGRTIEQLQPYVRRARENVALERAIQLDRQPNKS